MVSLYSIVLLYPFISVIILRLLGEEGNILVQIASEWYLFIAYTLLYIGVIVLFFFGVHFVLSTFVAFLMFTVGYFALSVVRKTIWTDTKEDSPS